jgi:hypothetical protein
MTLFPSRQQWKNWSLPSKHSTIGCFSTIILGVIGIAIACIAFIPKEVALQATDFRFRFTVASYKITEKELLKAPKSAACHGTVGELRVDCDLILIPTINRNTGGHGATPPRIEYEAQNIRFMNLDMYPTQASLSGKDVKLLMPFEFLPLNGPDVRYMLDVHIGKKWFSTSYQSGLGPLKVSLHGLGGSMWRMNVIKDIVGWAQELPGAALPK